LVLPLYHQEEKAMACAQYLILPRCPPQKAARRKKKGPDWIEAQVGVGRA
jgi:hypothetical protein